MEIFLGQLTRLVSVALTLAPAVQAVLRLEVARRVVVIATRVVALLTVDRMVGEEGELTAALARFLIGLDEVVRTLLNLHWKGRRPMKVINACTCCSS